MDIRSNNTEDANSATNAHHKKELSLPLIALGLVLLPVLLLYISSFGATIPMLSLFVILSPVVGLLTGISALNMGKERIGSFGKTIAIIAIALPLGLVTLIVLFFIGVTTGMISLM